jgi:uridine kinase
MNEEGNGTTEAQRSTLNAQRLAPDARRSVIVGIAGGSASGKTTLAAALLPAIEGGEPPLRVEPVGLDRYFYRGAAGGPRFVSPSSGEELPDNNHPNSADNARLVADLDARSRAEDAPDVLLVEGLMTLHVPEIRERLDVKLFVELDADLRALRRLLRDMDGGRGTRDPRWIATYYRECARVGHASYVEPSRAHADLIVRGDADFARIVPMLAAVIRSKVETRTC